MNNLYLVRGRLCRGLIPRPCHIIKRYKFSGRGPTTPAPRPVRTSQLPNSPARTRFAPSPTGYLHMGSLRTALYNYLLAKATGGQFILRIEDTDQTRIVPDAETRLYEDLKWAGLKWDEGPDTLGIYGPYKQSQRLNLYAEHAERLMEKGRAYRCFCTPHELEKIQISRVKNGESLHYNGKCSHIPPEESLQRAQAGKPHCIRFKSDLVPSVVDLVYGVYQQQVAPDDFVIIKRDGYPTYHFANVVDDHLMEISHVIRGAEWLISTPKHVALYEALGWQPPQFAHVGLLVDKNKQKLSKRNNMTDISAWRDRGVLPVALLNYVMLLGWSPTRNDMRPSEVMDLNDMITEFHLRFTRGDVVVNDKDEFFQQAHVRRLVEKSATPDQFADSFFPAIDRVIRMCEKDRRASPGGGGLVSRLKARLGPLVPRATLPDNRKKPAPGAGDPKVYMDYIRSIFSLDSKTYKHATEYLVRGKFLVWGIPESVFAEAVETALKTHHRIFLVPLEERSTIARNSKDKANWLAIHPEEKEKIYPPAKLSDLAARLDEILSAIPEDQWTTKTFNAQVLPFTETIFSTTKTDITHVWGYPFLRWVLYGSFPGPSLMQTMRVLGKEETMKRVKLACVAANKVESRWEDMEALANL